MLGVMRARHFEEFRTALAGFAVPGQTMVVAEAGRAPSGGRVGRVIAAHLPRRPSMPPASLVCAPEDAWGLDDLVIGAEAAAWVGEEPVASANDRPASTPVPVGFFFSPPDRINRLRTLLAGPRAVGPADLCVLQLDVLQAGALRLRDALLARMPKPARRDRHALAVLRGWDGSYAAAASAPVVFEVMVATLARRIIDRRRLAVLSAIWTTRTLIAREVAGAPPRALAAALVVAARALRRYRIWGNMHRMRLAHPLVAVPWLGRSYVSADFPAEGGNDTLNKTGHALTTQRHHVSYGACARHITNLAESDDNRFVLLGGQDGWLGSVNAADQAALWRAGDYISVPLRPEAARSRAYHTVLTP
jgi:penicillin amidase